jgi:hypothetical protein
MRWCRGIVVAVVVVALAACGGGGKKSSAAATGSSSNGSQVSAGSGELAASASGAAGDAPSGGDSPVVAAESAGNDPGGGQAATADAPAPSGLEPFAGKYRYQLTGQGAPTEIVVTIEDVNDTDQRSTTPGSGGQGDTIQTLRYLPNQIELESLEMKGAFPKTFNGPVMFAPIPSDVGTTWAWDLTSTDKLTHVHQSSRVDRTETVVIAGQSVDTFVVETDLTISGDVNATGHITSWASPVYKLAVRTHNTLNVTTPVQLNSDITIDLLDLRPS